MDNRDPALSQINALRLAANYPTPEKWAPEALSAGKHTLEFEFIYDELGMGTFAFNNLSGVGKPGEGILRVDGKKVARKKMEKTIPITLAWDESQDIGSDTETGVDDNDYQAPFPFNGKIVKITLDINRPQLSPEDIKKLEEGQRKAHDDE